MNTLTFTVDLLLFLYFSYVQAEISAEEYRRILFPVDLQYPENNSTALMSRKLLIRAVDTNPNCPFCTNLKYCRILNGYMAEEVYISKQYYESSYVGKLIETEGTCSVFEALGKRMYNEVFGKGKPFREDPQCREMVMQYLCLFWGSDNYMYRNSCIYKEDTTNPDPGKHKLTPRYPCRSFCVQIAKVCANSYDFLKVCSEIACPPTDTVCTPDPIISGQVLSLGLGCYMPIFNTPYGNTASSKLSISSTYLVMLFVFLLLSVFML